MGRLGTIYEAAIQAVPEQLIKQTSLFLSRALVSLFVLSVLFAIDRIL